MGGTGRPGAAGAADRSRAGGAAEGGGRGRGPLRAQKGKKRSRAYSVLNEWPQEQDFVTLGLLILKPEPMRLSM